MMKMFSVARVAHRVVNGRVQVRIDLRPIAAGNPAEALGIAILADQNSTFQLAEGESVPWSSPAIRVVEANDDQVRACAADLPKEPPRVEAN